MRLWAEWETLGYDRSIGLERYAAPLMTWLTDVVGPWSSSLHSAWTTVTGAERNRPVKYCYVRTMKGYISSILGGGVVDFDMSDVALCAEAIAHTAHSFLLPGRRLLRSCHRRHRFRAGIFPRKPYRLWHALCLPHNASFMTAHVCW